MTISHKLFGDGPAVLLVHAGVCDGRMWRQQLDDLGRDHNMVVPDLRGYGDTHLEVAEKYSDARDLLDLLDQLGLESVAAVGASSGADVLMQAASSAPKRFSRLVLFCPPVFTLERPPELKTFGAEEGRLLDSGDIEGATDLHVRMWLGPEANGEAQELLRVMQQRAFELQIPAGEDVEIERYELRPELLTMPVKLFVGRHDLQFFHESAEYLMASLPNAKLAELPWAGHLPVLERPFEATELIRAALAG
jgi:pimeloyl-ACP methyl ester carboxylesterase